MADKTTIARPYAKAAFAQSTAEGALSAWSQALRTGAAVMTDSRVHQLLGDPHVTPEQLAGLVAGIAGLNADNNASNGRNFIATLAENRRLDCLPEISALFDQMKDAAEGIADVTVTSATALTGQQAGAISAALANRLKRQVRLHTQVDPALLGGAVLRAGDLVIDGSVRGRLERIARDITA